MATLPERIDPLDKFFLTLEEISGCLNLLVELKARQMLHEKIIDQKFFDENFKNE